MIKWRRGSALLGHNFSQFLYIMQNMLEFHF